MKNISISFMLLLVVFSVCNAQVTTNFKKLTGEYLGQKPPGMIPEIFAPGIICTGFNERDISISPDRKEICYGFLTGKHITIMYTKNENGIWSEPAVAPFAADEKFYYLEPCFSADGNRIYFLSTLPPKGKEPKPRWTYQNIWAVDKKSDGSWSAPYNPDTLLNKDNVQFYPSLTKSGTIYFTKTYSQEKKSFICRSRFINGSYKEPEKLPSVINQEGTNVYNAFISPDESFLIACVDGRKNEVNPGYANYYVFFRDSLDNWSEGVSFGPEVNMKGSSAMSASVSPDGKYLFFAAQKINEQLEETSKRKNLSSMLTFLNSPQNGNYDIYWVDAEIINQLKEKK
ncbi:MAG: hypothetical protein C4539_06350 [Ignavibacteriales bacterium]|nr:MAG: hypothetical protein C4539_06350 [Ignavibacteriales bacterium]